MTEQQFKRHQNLTIRRVQEYTNSNSLGLVIPRNFVQRLDLKRGDYLRIEMYPDQTGFTVERIEL
jgi:antitoxin component of MazEF toxin-antitoxin module